MIAVLEHVVEPQVAVGEISRVLKYDGKVFSSIPFMQQVHMGCYDHIDIPILKKSKDGMWTACKKCE